MELQATEKACCGICKEKSDRGFYLLSLWICFSCERKMVELDVEDPIYAWYIERLRESKLNNCMLLH